MTESPLTDARPVGSTDVRRSNLGLDPAAGVDEHGVEGGAEFDGM